MIPYRADYSAVNSRRGGYVPETPLFGIPDLTPPLHATQTFPRYELDDPIRSFGSDADSISALESSSGSNLTGVVNPLYISCPDEEYRVSEDELPKTPDAPTNHPRSSIGAPVGVTGADDVANAHHERIVGIDARPHTISFPGINQANYSRPATPNLLEGLTHLAYPTPSEYRDQNNVHLDSKLTTRFSDPVSLLPETNSAYGGKDAPSADGKEKACASVSYFGEKIYGDTGILDDLLSYGASCEEAFSNIYIDEKKDTESIRALVSSRNALMQAKHPNWSDSLRMLALGVLHIVEIRDAHMRELAHFLYISAGEDYLRANDGHMYLYDDGAFSIFTGVITESLLSRCKIYGQEAEGALWCLGRRGLLSRRPTDILCALNSAFVDIDGVPLCDLEGV